MKTLHTLAPLAALALVGAACAETGTVVVHAAIPFSGLNWTKSLDLPQFDNSLLQLDSADIVFKGAVQGSLQFENRDSRSATYNARVCYLLTLNSPSNSTLLSVHPKCDVLSGTLPAFDGTLDYGGTSGVSSPSTAASETGSLTLTGADLTPFTGTGTVSLPAAASSTSFVRTPGNFSTVITNEASAEIEITYHYSYTPASVGDRVWLDKDGNGLQDAGEANVGGATVYLLDKDGNVVSTTTTDANGLYLFDGLFPGDYQVKFVAPNGAVFTTANAGDTNKDSDAGVGGLSAKFTLHSGEARRDIDAGIVGAQSLGDRVWFDLDADGVQDDGEVGIPDVGVTLLDGSGNVFATTFTDENGLYLFSGLLPGDYKVRFDKPADYAFSPTTAGGNANVDSDAGQADGTTGTVTLAAGDNRRDIDAGVYGLVSLGDRVWFDSDANGKQDDDEMGVKDLTVKLLDVNGVVVKTTTTDANGNYLFDELVPGQYQVRFSKPSGYSYTVANAGADDNLDSDADGGGLSPMLLVSSDRLDVDAGLVGTLCLGDKVWRDDNKDGLQQSCEPGVANVIVRLLDQDGNEIAQTKTDRYGNYKFSNLAPGDYIVDFQAPNGYGFTKQFAKYYGAPYPTYDSNADPLTGQATVNLSANDMTIDAGLIGALKIGDTVWKDSDGDGKYEPEVGEQGIPCVKVFLVGDTNGDGWPDVAASTTTDKDGHYVFLGLKPGKYAVTVNAFDIPSRLTPSYDLDGIGTRHIAIGTLGSTDRLDFDFGYKPYTAPNCGSSHTWWNCNPSRWNCDKIWVGGKCHTRTTVCSWFKKSDGGDKSICMYQRLCAAKLNVGDGCNGNVRITCGRTTMSVKDAIKCADAWLARNPAGCRVSGNSSNWNSVCDVYGILDKFCGGR